MSETVTCMSCGDLTDPQFIVDVTVLDDESADGYDQKWCTMCSALQLMQEISYLHPDEAS